MNDHTEDIKVVGVAQIHLFRCGCRGVDGDWGIPRVRVLGYHYLNRWYCDLNLRILKYEFWEEGFGVFFCLFSKEGKWLAQCY